MYLQFSVLCVSGLIDGSRTQFLKTRNCMVQCSFQSSPGVTRQQCQLPLEVKNTTPSTHHLETLQILPVVDMGTVLFLSPSFQSQRVRQIHFVDLLRGLLFPSQQTSAKTSRFSDILPPAVSQVSRLDLRTPQGKFNEANTYEVP